jgi:hypothetical protein
VQLEWQRQLQSLPQGVVQLQQSARRWGQTLQGKRTSMI